MLVSPASLSLLTIRFILPLLLNCPLPVHTPSCRPPPPARHPLFRPPALSQLQLLNLLLYSTAVGVFGCLRGVWRVVLCAAVVAKWVRRGSSLVGAVVTAIGGIGRVATGGGPFKRHRYT